MKDCKGRSRRIFSDQIKNFLKKDGVSSLKNKRACMKILINKNKARKFLSE